MVFCFYLFFFFFIFFFSVFFFFLGQNRIRTEGGKPLVNGYGANTLIENLWVYFSGNNISNNFFFFFFLSYRLNIPRLDFGLEEPIVELMRIFQKAPLSSRNNQMASSFAIAVAETLVQMGLIFVLELQMLQSLMFR
jgi:hypothetical protein